jgi:hypothetical protein
VVWSWRQTSGVERTVLHVFEGAAMELIRAASRSGRNVSDLRKLCVIADSLHLHFGDTFDRRKQLAQWTVRRDAHRRDAIERNFGLGRQPALQREAIAVVALDAGLIRQQRIWAGSACAAVVDWQSEHLLRVKRCRNRGRVGGDHWGGGLYFHRLRDRADFQREVHAQRLPRLEIEAGVLQGPESLG